MSSPPLVVALAELTQMLGVTKNRAMQVSKKSDFPAPVAELSVGRVWSYEAVLEFCERTGRTVYPLKAAVTAADDAQHLGQFGRGDNQRRRTHHRTLSTGTAEYWHTR